MLNIVLKYLPAMTGDFPVGWHQDTLVVIFPAMLIPKAYQEKLSNDLPKWLLIYPVCHFLDCQNQVCVYEENKLVL